MPIPFTAATALPNRFTVGEVVTWTETLSSYAAGTFTIAYKFISNTPVNGIQQFAISGAGVGNVWTFATPSTPKAGNYAWEKQVTQVAGSVMRVEGFGRITILPNFASAIVETTASTMVLALTNAIQALIANPSRSVSFNGQSASIANLAEMQTQLVYWKSQVIQEQNALADLSGVTQRNRIVTVFQPTSCAPPFVPWYPGQGCCP